MGIISASTIGSPEFVNVTSISPLISKCEIKVFYVGGNRNGSFIDKDTASQMAQTLPGCPIVGYYIENKEDFGDHGEQVIIDVEGIRFKTLTKPYGFVAPNSRIWFQQFEEVDTFGNKAVREYLMTEGYLWTGQFPECKAAVESGKPHSMELDDDTLKGYWSTDENRGVDFFIINDAIISKLCMLGDDVEPCFEGSMITSPDVSARFTNNNNDFNSDLMRMKEELRFALRNEGGNSMPEENTVIEEVVTDVPSTEVPTAEENFSATMDNEGEQVTSENQINTEIPTEEFANKPKDEEEKKDEPAEDKKDDSEEDPENEEDKKKKKPETDNTCAGKDDEDEKKKFELLQKDFEELQNSYSLLKTEYDALVEFKNNVENTQKDALIDSFFMLSDEDKKDVVENKAKYSLDEIEAKLSVICVRKKVSFNVDTEEKENKPETATTYNINSIEQEELPAWLKAVEARQNQ